MKWKHIISAEQFSLSSLQELFEEAAIIQEDWLSKKTFAKKDLGKLLKGKVMVELFYQASTRTRFSFAMAMQRLGGSVIATENARVFSSAAKGESLEDSILTVTEGLGADVVVLRYDKVGGATRAAEVSSVPIINAGDGPGEHPTQALLDLFTIEQELDPVESLDIAIVGDLFYSRTVHSLAKLLAIRYKNVKITFVSPAEIKLDDATKNYLVAHYVNFSEETDLREVMKKVEVVYMTRIQEEYYKNDQEKYQKVIGQYQITPDILPRGKASPLIMHPLPRKGEIAFSVDQDQRAIYFKQINYGLFLRMALLTKILS